MTKREYKGDPLDHTYKHIGDREGETVGGTTEDDLFDVEYQWLPNHIDEQELTEKQKEALETYVKSPKENNFAEIADGHGFSGSYLKKIVHEVFRGNRDYDDLTEKQQLCVLAWAYHGLETPTSELAGEYPVSARTFRRVKRSYPDIIEEKDSVSKPQLNNKIQNITGERVAETEGQVRKAQIPKEEKEYPDDFSECYTWFIETISENPSISAGGIKPMIPEGDGDAKWSHQNYYNVVTDYADIIYRRMRQKNTIEDTSEIHHLILKHMTKNPDESSNKDQAVEPHKEVLGRYYDLDQSADEIIDEMDKYDTPAQIYGVLGRKGSIPEREWVVPDEEDSIEEGDDLDVQQANSAASNKRSEDLESQPHSAVETQPQDGDFEKYIARLVLDQISDKKLGEIVREAL